MRHLKCSKNFDEDLEKENEEMRKFLLKEDCKLLAKYNWNRFKLLKENKNGN